MSIGCRTLSVADPVQGAQIALALLYPAHGEELPHAFGPYSVAVAMDAVPVGEGWPVAVISHGNNGTPWAYRDLALALVQAGFIVAMPEHPGNCRSDRSLEKSAANLENRPRHISLVIEATLADPQLARHIDATRIAVIGHSIGGYTALAVAGATPWISPPYYPTPFGLPCTVPVKADKRVRALVLLAPATFWYAAPEALRGVTVPVMIRAAQKDTITPARHADAVARRVGTRPEDVDMQIVANAGHFSFMSPFPAAMIRADFAPAHDPPGFDRAAYMPVLADEIIGFLGRSFSGR